MKLEIYEDNSARYHWTLSADDGHGLASSSEAFASYDTALQAAQNMRDHAATSTIDAG